MTHRNLLRSVHWRLSVVSPLSASLACDLIRPDDSVSLALACWWIATKFEEITPIDPMDVVEDWGLEGISLEDVRESELEVLTRIHFQIPHRTIVRAIFEQSDRVHDFELLHDWLFALMDSNLVNLRTADEWVDLLNTFSARRHSLLQLALDLSSNRIRRAILLKYPRPQRLEMKVVTPTGKRARTDDTKGGASSSSYGMFDKRCRIHPI